MKPYIIQMLIIANSNKTNLEKLKKKFESQFLNSELNFWRFKIKND